MRALHLGRTDWAVGQTLSVDWEKSNYWRARFDGREPRLPALELELNDVPDIKKCCAGAIGVVVRPLGAMPQSAKKNAEVLKEYVFEDVRRRDFTKLPSRWRCLFAVPEERGERGAVEILRAMNFPAGTLMLLDLLDEARIHRADSALLNCNNQSPDGIEAEATKYWSGDGTPDEILYEGEFTVLKILHAPFG